ncbi:uncharacterized protein METZ01_LOCUS190086, partial [marine metagenome]
MYECKDIGNAVIETAYELTKPD